jgi:uncharacterized OB-fold protein
MTAEKNRVPVLEGLFAGPSGEPHLLGGRCRGCDSRFFPSRWETHDPKCEHPEIEEIPLSRRGRLASYTVHRFQAPPPFRMEPYEPYAIGAVELPEDLLVIGMLTGVDVDDIAIGAEVELVLGRLFTDDDGNDVVTYMWRLTGE